MTLIGIGGCMGLLMVGYGLRDSISSISQYQYGELQLYDCSVYLSDDIDDEEVSELESYLKENKDIHNHMNGRMESVTTQYEEESIETNLVVVSDTNEGEEFFHYRDRKSKEVYYFMNETYVLVYGDGYMQETYYDETDGSGTSAPWKNYHESLTKVKSNME